MCIQSKRRRKRRRNSLSGLVLYSYALLDPDLRIDGCGSEQQEDIEKMSGSHSDGQQSSRCPGWEHKVPVLIAAWNSPVCFLSQLAILRLDSSACTLILYLRPSSLGLRAHSSAAVQSTQRKRLQRGDSFSRQESKAWKSSTWRGPLRNCFYTHTHRIHLT